MPWVPRGVTEYGARVRGFNRNMRLYILATVISFLNIGVFQVLYNLYLNRLGLREDYIGIFNAVTTVAIAVSSLSTGWLVNRFGARKVVLVGFFLFTVTSAAQALFEQAAILLVFAGLQGMATAYFINPTMLLVIEYTTNETRQYASSIVYAAQAFSGTLGNLGGGMLPRLLAALAPGLVAGSINSYRVTLLVGVAVASLAVVPFARMRETGLERRGEIAGVSRPHAPESRKERGTSRTDFTMFVLTGAILAVGTASVVPFYNVFLKNIGASTQAVGYIYAGAALFAAFVSLAGPAVAARLGTLNAVFAFRIAPLVFFVGLIFSPVLWLAIPAHAVRVTSVNASWPLDSTFISELLPARQRAYVFSIRSVFWNAAWSVTSVVMGNVIRATNSYRSAFTVYAVFLLLNVVLFQFYYKRRVAQRARERATLPPAPARA